MKNVVIIVASPRKKGNSATLAQEFARGAKESGNRVETVYLADKHIGFCKGCLACQESQRCVIADDAVGIAETMKNADVLVFATPVYYYSVCGQLKTMLDRANPLYSSDYKFREVYLLATAAEDAPDTVKGAESDVQGWVDCFGRARFAGTVFGGGVYAVGDIQGHKALNKAYQAGKAIKE